MSNELPSRDEAKEWPCPGNDETCPGHDHGDPCHYRGADPMGQGSIATDMIDPDYAHDEIDPRGVGRC